MIDFEVLGVPIKSPNDLKEYRVIKLKNGLKALLIKSATDDQTSACYLKVNVGSFDNPDHVAGLAHFLEHAIHMGSVKYPSEESYTKFIQSNGGGMNASTASENTNYYFSISENAFVEAVDMFSSMITAPLLNVDAMQREREAVDSEYRRSLPNDFTIVEYIHRNFAKENNPYKKFSCGNLKTLKENISDEELHRETLKFFEKYGANLMYLTIQSSRSLDELQSLVVEKFSGIKSFAVEKNLRPSYDEAFKSEFFTKVIYIKPKNNDKKLTFTWILPPYHIDYKTNLIPYIDELINNKGDGGLNKFLRNHNVNRMYWQGARDMNEIFSMSKLSIEVNTEELKNDDIEKILEAVYSYMTMVKETPIEIHRRKYDEFMKRQKLDFIFEDESDALTNVSILSNPLKSFNTEDIMRYKTMVNFDEIMFKNIMNHLCSDQFNLTIFDPKHENFNRRDETYQRDYDCIEYPESWKKIWENRASRPEFFIAEPNKFIAENFEIYENSSESPQYPEKVHECATYELRHKLDSTFKSPKAIIKICFTAPSSFNNIEASVYGSIYEELLTHHLSSSVEDGKTADLLFNSWMNEREFSINTEGYNDKLLSFFGILVDKIKNFNENIEGTHFKSTLIKLKSNNFDNSSHVSGLNNAVLNRILYQILNRSYEKFTWIKNNTITLKHVKSFVARFFQRSKVQILVQGNIRRSDAFNVLNILRNAFKVEPIVEELELREHCRVIPIGTKIVRIKSMKKLDENSIIKSYYQIGKATVRVKILVSILTAILKPKAYNYLRSKEQLGYEVSFRSTEVNGIMGVQIYVGSQESKHLHTKVYEKISYFMREVARLTIEDLTDEEWNNLKTSLMNKKKKTDKTLVEEVQRNWSEISSMDHNFDIKNIESQTLETIKKSEVQEFFKSFTQPENARVLNVHVIGDASTKFDEPKLETITEKFNDDEEIITDIDEFKQSLYLYPIVKFEI